MKGIAKDVITAVLENEDGRLGKRSTMENVMYHYLY